MTTERDLIQRMAKELDLYRQMARDDCTSTHPFADEARALLAQPEPVPETKARELLNLLLDDLDALIDSSEGVAGLHLNGDIASWESLRQGGRFETWLTRMDESRAFLDSTMDKPAGARPAIEPEGPTEEELIRRLLLLAEQAVKEALDFEYEDPEDRYIWRELQELKQLAEKGRRS